MKFLGKGVDHEGKENCNDCDLDQEEEDRDDIDKDCSCSFSSGFNKTSSISCYDCEQMLKSPSEKNRHCNGKNY